MPPFRAGLLKRKAKSTESVNRANTDNSDGKSDSGSDEDLLQTILNTEGDETDSEHEDKGDDDGDVDEVLFDESGDSTLGDEAGDDSADESSELEDSEADIESEDGDEEGDDEDDGSGDDDGDKEALSDDSGAELSTGPAPSSEDSDAQQKKNDVSTKKNNKLKQKTKQNNQKNKKQTKKSSVDILADKIKEGSANIQPVGQKDEYESGDTSDEEDRVNSCGEVPRWWYDEYQHVGYDLDGRKIIKPPQRDQIDEFLKKCEDPDFWRTVKDPATGQDIVLSTKDLQLIQRIRQGNVPSEEHDEYQPWVEWFTREVLATPLRAFPEHKRSFLPSRDEQKHIAKIVHALKMGWTKTRKQIAEERKKNKERKFYNLWGSKTAEEEEEERRRGVHRPLPAPRRPPPTHAESYNPPPEYLLDSKEMKEWNKLAETPWKRKYTFLPTQHSSLRAVPAFPRYTRERFLRCLDLYLAPRAIKMKLQITADQLVPVLPSPRELQPFPTSEALCLRGHSSLVRSIDFDPSGQYIVSASDDNTVKVWETSTGRCLRTIKLDTSVCRVRWTPARGLSVVAAAAGRRLLLLNPGADIGAHRVAADTDLLLQDPPPQHDVTMDERTRSAVTWDKVTPEEWALGVRVALTHFKPLTYVSWHARGDYVCCVLGGDSSVGARGVLVHHVSRRRSQLPLARPRGLVQAAVFHPTRPVLFVATQRVVRMYDLVKQELVKKLLTGAQWISDLVVHPAGDNLLVSSYDRKCIWFDLELSSKPYQTLRLHGGAVRGVAFHPRYPLWASAGDDQNIVVSHGMVYNDLLQNPLLVPLKQLRGPTRRDDLCVLELKFHPTQPWLAAAGADNTIRLFS